MFEKSYAEATGTDEDYFCAHINHEACAGMWYEADFQTTHTMILKVENGDAVEYFKVQYLAESSSAVTFEYEDISGGV
jgi:hypothetical protein